MWIELNLAGAVSELGVNMSDGTIKQRMQAYVLKLLAYIQTQIHCPNLF
jgi:hypothetical protein